MVILSLSEMANLTSLLVLGILQLCIRRLDLRQATTLIPNLQGFWESKSMRPSSLLRGSCILREDPDHRATHSIPLVIRSNGQIPTTPRFAPRLNHCAIFPGPLGCPDGYFVCCVAKVTNVFMNTCHQANTQARPTWGQHGPVVVSRQEPPIQHTPCSPALASTIFSTLPQLSRILVLTSCVFWLSSICS